MLQELNVHDCLFYVDDATYNDDEAGAHLGVHYWEKYLNHDEISAFFHAAKADGHATFETNHGKHYKLTYQDGRYILERHHMR